MSAGRVTRRRLLGTAIAGGAASAVPVATARAATAAPVATAATKQADFVVIGAGLAGLTAARNLVKAGRSVVVLEARDRVGGRTLNHDLGFGKVTEVGGQFVGPTQNRIIALADELGVKQFPGYNPGQAVYIANGLALRYDGDIPPDPLGLADLTQTIARLDDMSTRVPVDAPWEAAEKVAWDAQTIDTWLRANTVNAQRTVELFDLFLNSGIGGHAADTSLLFMLAQIAGFGDERNPGTIERAIGGKGGAQDSRFVGGSQIVSQRAAQELGGRVVLSAPVRRIEQTATGVTVISDAGTVKAGRAIVAIPPPLAVGIDWQPLLPPRHDALRRRMALGTLAKVFAVYDQPFWRKDGLSGMALKIGGTVKEMFDNSPPDGSPGVLMGFLGGPSWRTWFARSDADRRAAVLADFAEAFGPKALLPTAYFEQDWTAEPWTRGGPVSAMGTGTMSDFGAMLCQPFGRVHWAGTETATYWNGYMDGAVRSGERAAQEVLGA
ncbi:MAG: monoamine oxidase [Baekduia sp.]|nr:monoamine oxidase [Baekduia sp.]